jgi:CDP-diglyceride synthetase
MAGPDGFGNGDTMEPGDDSSQDETEVNMDSDHRSGEPDDPLHEAVDDDGWAQDAGGEVVPFPGFQQQPTGVFGPDDEDVGDPPAWQRGPADDDEHERGDTETFSLSGMGGSSDVGAAADAGDEAAASDRNQPRGAAGSEPPGGAGPADSRPRDADQGGGASGFGRNQDVDDDFEDDFGDVSTDPFESFTEEQYRSSTTREYRGLAEAIEQSSREKLAPQAVSATMPGVATGVVGFDDMTGEEAADLEEIHAQERVQRGDLFLRLGTAVGLIAVLVGALLAGGRWIAMLLGLVVVLSLGEFYASVRRAGYVPVALFGFLGSIGLLIGAWRSGPFAIGGFLAATCVAVSLWFALVPRRNPLDNAVITLLGVGWITALMAFAYPIFQSGDAVPLVGALVVLTALFDVASYFVGRGLGRTPLAPVLSPNKTLEGLIGGVIMTVAAGAAMGVSGLVEPFTLTSGLALGVAVSVFAPIGDLAESLVKRLLGVKDMGSILPGHGGMLDRVDGFIFSIPAAYLVYFWFGYLQ